MMMGRLPTPKCARLKKDSDHGRRAIALEPNVGFAGVAEVAEAFRVVPARPERNNRLRSSPSPPYAHAITTSFKFGEQLFPIIEQRDGARGTRKTMIVALARKRLIALWRLVREDVMPDGVILRPAQ